MTTQDFSELIPTKFKPWVALLGSVLTFLVPSVTAAVTDVGGVWPGVLAAVLAGLTWLGVYRVPYAPKGTVPVLVPEVRDSQTVIPPNVPPAGEYRNPWTL